MLIFVILAFLALCAWAIFMSIDCITYNKTVEEQMPFPPAVFLLSLVATGVISLFGVIHSMKKGGITAEQIPEGTRITVYKSIRDGDKWHHMVRLAPYNGERCWELLTTNNPLPDTNSLVKGTEHESRLLPAGKE